MAVSRVLTSGTWRRTIGTGMYEKRSPIDASLLGRYPLSSWSEIDEALKAGSEVFRELRGLGPEPVALFLERFSAMLEGAADELVEVAHGETALPESPRLRDVELPRTVGQLRLAAQEARSRAWTLPTISPSSRIASYLAPIPGVVVVFGPNNFPFAFNPVSGGDFAAAIATGHPVLAVANPGHPASTELIARLAEEARSESNMPESLVQMCFGMQSEDGLRLVADRRVAATAYTGSRESGLALKRAAEEAGRPIYLEMSSANPVFVLQGAIAERGNEIARELAESAVLGGGQFCTSPGLVFVPESSAGDLFVAEFTRRVTSAPSTVLLDDRVRRNLEDAYRSWEADGAELIGRADSAVDWSRYPSTVMSVSSQTFQASSESLQTEAFGNMVLIVRYGRQEDLVALASLLEGSLTGCIYSSSSGTDDTGYDALAPILRERVGRLLNDKVPTGVDVVAAMNHGGPYPSTGHPGFTAVGMPASLRRLGMLQSFDSVRPERLPPELHPSNPLNLERYVDGRWTTDEVTWA